MEKTVWRRLFGFSVVLVFGKKVSMILVTLSTTVQYWWWYMHASTNLGIYVWLSPLRGLGVIRYLNMESTFSMSIRHEYWILNTLMLVYHCHKPVFTPKIAIFQRGGMREGGLPLPTTFQYLIFMISRACDWSWYLCWLQNGKTLNLEVFNFIS